MKNFLKNLGLAFKNKNTTAQSLWEAIGAPISIAKTMGKYKNFTEEFFNDPYLCGWLTGYLKFMLENFFRITDATKKGEILMKFYERMDPNYFTKLDNFRKVNSMIKTHQEKKTAKDAVDSAFMTVAMFLNSPSKNQFASDPIYLEAEKFYQNGEWAKKQHIQSRIMGEKTKSINMPEHQAIAFRIMEITFMQQLYKKFKITNKL